MKNIEYYRGREQTYLKHFFLERYLERVAYVIGYSQAEFIYVDGFSGPWQSKGEAFEDTSFMIAIHQLRRVRGGLAKIGKTPRIRCLFIEKDPKAFRALEKAVSNISEFDVKALQGEFEELISDILRFIRQSFALVFIDPTGWTGFGLKKIEPILQHRPSEVLVNFMFDYINRFLDDPRPEIAKSFDELMGGPSRDLARQPGRGREAAIVTEYRERMRKIGGFKHVTSTRILKPTENRSYFYLVYGTRHVKGLLEFRKVEKKTVAEQERVRLTTKQLNRVERTHQEELFSAEAIATGPRSFEEEKGSQLNAAANRLRAILRNKPRIDYADVLGVLMEMPLVWESDVQNITKDARATGELDVENFSPRQRTIKPGHLLVLKKPK